MKKQVIFLVFLIFALFFVHSVSAENFNEPVVTITPDKSSYAPGDKVSMSINVLLTSSGSSTFPGSHSLRASTGLENVVWEYRIIQNGNQPPATTVSKAFIRIDGFQLEYPADSNEISLAFDLQGKVPSVESTGDIDFFRFTQFDQNGNIIQDEFVEEKLVVNPDDIEKLRDIVETNLGNLKTQIEDKLKAGVDTASTQAKYDIAREKWVQSATASYSDANTLLGDAQTLIADAEKLLNQAWAQKSIDEAQSTINSVAFYITDFKVNRSLTNDARVINIETKVESAQSSLNSARSLMNDKNYPQAYTLAETASTKAEEALSSAQTLYAEVSRGIIPDVGGAGIFLIIGIIAVIAIVGFLIYRKQTSWDELG